MYKATQDLREEHETILYLLKILEKMMESNEEEDSVRFNQYNNLIYFLRIFAEDCHHGKEEKHLFPELINNGFQKEDGPLAHMLQEHRQARAYTVLMSEAMNRRDITGFKNSAEKYIELSRNHIEKEENIIFDMADKIIDEEAQDLLYERFSRHEETVIGHGVHKKLRAMIHKWA
jgi:hemerythrin-like domain-containing protein